MGLRQVLKVTGLVVVALATLLIWNDTYNQWSDWRATKHTIGKPVPEYQHGDLFEHTPDGQHQHIFFTCVDPDIHPTLYNYETVPSSRTDGHILEQRQICHSA